MSESAASTTLSASQNYAFQYIDKILREMEPFSNSDIDTDIDDIDINIVSYLYFKIDLHNVTCNIILHLLYYVRYI